MKLDFHETSDRLDYFVNQDFDIAKCCQDIIDQRPFGNHAFYLFVHARTADDGFTKNLIWQPRLTKPSVESNSMLFRVKPGSDEIKIVWLLPPKLMWSQFRKGLLMENKIICDSIHAYQTNKAAMEAPDKDDLTDVQVKNIYAEIANNAAYDKVMKKAFPNKDELIGNNFLPEKEEKVGYGETVTPWKSTT